MNQFNFFDHTHVMGIINVTPDSFSGDGILTSGVSDAKLHTKNDFIAKAIEQAHSFVDAGCHMLDIGAESTRPGARPLNASEEIDRLIPVIDAVHRHVGVPISVDTTKASVARAAFAHGATIINDISGLMNDPEMIDVAVHHQCYTIIMNSQTYPFDRNMPHTLTIEETELGGRYVEKEPVYNSRHFVACVLSDLEKRSGWALEKGLQRDRIILDVGIGFGKTIEQNLALVAKHALFKTLNFPLLLGVSRKSFIGYSINAPVNQRLGGSLAALTIGVLGGANIVRVHDVFESVQACNLINMVKMNAFDRCDKA